MYVGYVVNNQFAERNIKLCSLQIGGYDFINVIHDVNARCSNAVEFVVHETVVHQPRATKCQTKYFYTKTLPKQL